MKRMLWMLAALLMAGCEQSPIEERTMPDQPVEFWATFEGTDESVSRTYLDEQSRMRWTADDRLTIFKKTTYNREFAFTGKTGANAGGFRQVSVDDDFWFGYDVDYNYAIYPHAADNAFDETDCFFTATLPAEQTYVANSFGPGANTMVAVSESGQLLFKNVCSYLRVMLYGADQSVKKITLSSIADEALAGEAKIYASLTDDPTCTMVGTTSSIVLNCEEAITVNTTEETPVSFWIVVPPVTLSKGYKITVENADGETQEFAVNKVKTFTRNVYSTLKRELTIGQTIDPSTAVPSNQIWYTSSDETMIEPAATGESVFGATITSHTYNNGLGIITFSGNVTQIGSNAFNAKTKLVTISLPETVTEIGSKAFQNCTRLTEISAPKVTTISSYAFDNCAKLAAVPFASNLTSVGSYAFQKCTSLTSLNLKNVTSLGSYAFYECSKLEQATLLALKGSIGSFTFYNCAKLKEINIPEGVTKIRISAFRDCGALTSVTIPNSVTTIEDYAFCSCCALTSVTIPDSVTKIGSGAFSDCSSLTSATIPESVTTIGVSAFDGCSSLTSVYISDLESWCNISFSNTSSSPCYQGAILYLDGTPLTDLTIPESVTAIGYGAFYGCSSLTSVTIPNSITTIGESVFHSCSSLTSVTIPDSVTEIGGDAFFRCSSLTSVYISDLESWCNISFSNTSSSPCCQGAILYLDGTPLTDLTIPESVTAIGYGAFLGCSSLTSVTIPESVTAIGNGAFSGCSSLTSVTIPDSVTEIGGGAFLRCSSLTSVTIPDSVTTIEASAFSGCSSLTSVTIPESVTAIGNLAFYGCSSLTSVTIPDSVTTIGNSAFSGCSSLTSIYCKPTTPPTLGNGDVFDHNAYDRKIYVPASDDDSIITAYKAATRWSGYADYIVEYEFME